MYRNRHFKKAKLLILILWFPALLNAQKLEKQIIDHISGDTSVSTKKEAVFSRTLMADVLAIKLVKIKLAKTNSISYSLEFEITKEYGHLFSVKSGSLVSIKFTDGSVITIPAAFDGYFDIKHAGGESYYSGSAWYNLDGKNLSELKSKEISFIRIETSEATFDYEIKKKNADVVKKHLELITKSQ